ncbi:MAG: heparinase II/III family protein [Gloeobacteraceae cyanobacterium ES-bin-144]|nr:heparinase II/III family protein [Verrucomicrobiales bacterium]
MKRCVFAIGGAVLFGQFSLGGETKFPKAEPEKAFAEMKIYSAEGKPWRAAREDWVGAKERVANDAEWAKWLVQERSELDAWIGLHRDHVEWISGWHHDGVSPKDGSRLTWDERVPGSEVKFLSTPSDPKVEVTPKLMAWWVCTFRSEHAKMMLRAAKFARLTGEAKYAEWAAAQLDFYAVNYQKWQPQTRGGGSRLFWQTLDCATRMTQYLLVIRQLGDSVTESRKQSWRTSFIAPEIEVLTRTGQQIHNIPTWHRCTQALYGLVYRDEAAWENALEGEFGLRAQLEHGVTSDYFWYEQSLGYNDYVVRALIGIFTEVGIAGRASELSPEMSIAENLLFSPYVLSFPGGVQPSPADGSPPRALPNEELAGVTYRFFPTAAGLKVAADMRNWDALLDPPAEAREIHDFPPVTSKHLESTRMAVLKSGPWQVFFHYGQLVKSHSQAEALNYSVFYGDTDISHDPGTGLYGSPLYNGYFRQGLCHNVPLMNGEGQAPPQQGEMLEFSTDPPVASATQAYYRPNTKASRRLTIIENRLIDTATIETAEKKGQRPGLALHLQGKIHLPSGFRTDQIFGEGRPEAFQYWQDVTGAKFRDRAVFEVEYAKLRMRVTITTPGVFRVCHGSSPDVPPTRRESLYVETQGSKATFITTYEAIEK